MSRLSRRSLVAGAAAIPAAAALPLPAGADPAAAADAELLRLGTELARVGQEWFAQRAIDAKQSAAWEAACEAAGLPRIEYGSIPDDEWRAHQERRSALSARDENDVDEHGESIVWDSIHDRMWGLIDDIFDHTPQTLAGFAVQAHALVLDNSEWWGDGIGVDESERRAQSFLENFCAFAGVTPAPILGGS